MVAIVGRYDDNTYQRCIRKHSPRDKHGNLLLGVKPRQTRYGDSVSLSDGVIPIEQIADEYGDYVKIIEWADLEDVVQRCHEDKIFPMYWQLEGNVTHPSWMKEWQKLLGNWSQNALNFCWAWGGASTAHDTRAAEGKPTVLLAPNSAGHLVNWTNSGNYLSSMNRGMRENGLCPLSMVSDQHSRSPRGWESGWEEEALNYRVDEIWDTNSRDGERTMILHCATILSLGRSLYIAYNWWSHALSCVGIRIENGKVIWIIRNSHGESGFIELDGSRGVPDEAYGYPSMITAKKDGKVARAEKKLWLPNNLAVAS